MRKKNCNSSNLLRLLKAKKLSQQITRKIIATGITEKELQEKVYKTFDEIYTIHKK